MWLPLGCLQVALASAEAPESSQPQAVGAVAPGATLELDTAIPAAPLVTTAPALQPASSGAAGSAEAGTAEDVEEEEAFLEAVTGQRGAVAAAAEGWTGHLLLARPQGSAQWAVGCALQPGARSTSGVWPMLHVWVHAGSDGAHQPQAPVSCQQRLCSDCVLCCMQAVCWSGCNRRQQRCMCAWKTAARLLSQPLQPLQRTMAALCTSQSQWSACRSAYGMTSAGA